MTRTAPDASGPPPAHSRIEDAQGIAFGAMMSAFGAFLLGSAGLITGQLAGLSLLVAQATGYGFGPVYLVLSLPFCGFGYRRLGAGFLRRTIAAVLLMVAVSMALPRLIGFQTLHPGAAAVLAGAISGAGLLALFRHRTSLGGIGSVALDLQDRLGIRAGWVQMGFDAVLFAGAFLVLPWQRVLWSALGAAVLNLVIAINHRGDRYTAWPSGGHIQRAFDPRGPAQQPVIAGHDRGTLHHRRARTQHRDRVRGPFIGRHRPPGQARAVHEPVAELFDQGPTFIPGQGLGGDIAKVDVPPCPLQRRNRLLACRAVPKTVHRQGLSHHRLPRETGPVRTAGQGTSVIGDLLSGAVWTGRRRPRKVRRSRQRIVNAPPLQPQ